MLLFASDKMVDLCSVSANFFFKFVFAFFFSLVVW